MTKNRFKESRPIVDLDDPLALTSVAQEPVQKPEEENEPEKPANVSPQRVEPQVKEPQKKEKEPAAEINGLAAVYEEKRRSEIEPRTVRIQAVVTATTARNLDKLVKEDKIKSRNDLINFLLERYFETVELKEK